MLLNSVVIVLREVVEAVVLISVLLASAGFLKLRNHWVLVALFLGATGAVTYGILLGPVSELFDGVGQEICNAMLQFSAFATIVAIAFLIPCCIDNPRYLSRIRTLMVIAVALTITREGAEILIYVSGFLSMADFFSAVAIGSLIGACIGISIGVLIYYLLLAQPSRRALPITIALLFLVAAGMSSQAVRQLIQADWISTAGAIWDTSSVLNEQSLLGQLLYALIGYEASPAAVEVFVYVGSIVLVVVSFFAGRRFGNHPSGNLQ